MSATKYYYEARSTPNASYYGIVYHYTGAGYWEEVDYKSDKYDTEEEALDDAAEWLDDKEIEAELC